MTYSDIRSSKTTYFRIWTTLSVSSSKTRDADFQVCGQFAAITSTAGATIGGFTGGRVLLYSVIYTTYRPTDRKPSITGAPRKTAVIPDSGDVMSGLDIVGSHQFIDQDVMQR